MNTAEAALAMHNHAAAANRYFFFQSLITLQPKVSHRRDASQNDTKSKGYAFKTSKAALALQNSAAAANLAAAADSAVA